jgi:Flp pilus assembly protein TadB
MNSEREKREEEIKRLMQEASASQEADVAFQEELKKAAATLFEEETKRIQKSEQAEQRKRPLNPLTAGLWLFLLGAAAFVFSMPIPGAVLFLCGTAAIVRATVLKRSKKMHTGGIKSFFNKRIFW